MGRGCHISRPWKHGFQVIWGGARCSGGKEAEARIIIWRNFLIVQSALRWYPGFVLKSSFRCVVWKLRDFFFSIVMLTQGQLGSGETRMCAGLVTQSIVGVLLSSSSAEVGSWVARFNYLEVTGRCCDLKLERGYRSEPGKQRNRRANCRRK